jgi:hypothetical protein
METLYRVYLTRKDSGPEKMIVETHLLTPHCPEQWRQPTVDSAVQKLPKGTEYFITVTGPDGYRVCPPQVR